MSATALLQYRRRLWDAMETDYHADPDEGAEALGLIGWTCPLHPDRQDIADEPCMPCVGCFEEGAPPPLWWNPATRRLQSDRPAVADDRPLWARLP